MPPALLTRNNYRPLLAAGLHLLWDTTSQQIVEELAPLFKMDTSDQAYETELGMAGLGSPGVVAEGDIPRYDAYKLAWPVTYIHTKFGLGVQLTKEAKDDDKYNKIASKAIPELRKSFARERNIQGANILNNAFTTVGYEPDGQPLVSANHPLTRPGYGGAATVSNLLTTPLSVAGLQAARARLRKNLNDNGEIMPLVPKYLIVPPSLESLAEELTKSTMRPGQQVPTVAASTANPTGAGNYTTPTAGTVTTPSEINLPYARGLEVVVMNYLADNGQWFLAAEEAELKWFDREKLNTDDVYDPEARAIKFLAFARWSVGFSAWRGIVGYPGS